MKKIILIVVGVIFIALLGRLGWAFWQVRSDEGQKIISQAEPTDDIKNLKLNDTTGVPGSPDFDAAPNRESWADDPESFVVTVGSAVSIDTFNQQKITVDNTASKFTCGLSTVIGTNSEVYNTVQIGTQCWIKQDVKGGLYTWAKALRLPPGCDTSSCKVTTNQQGVCPSGWHIPTDMEFKTLRMFLGMSESDASQAIFGGTDQGTKLKVGGTSGFDAITDSGFNAFWTSSEDSATKAWVLSLFASETTIGRGTNNKTHPTSVRCLKN